MKQCIDNNLYRDICPICSSNEIGKIGPISYDKSLVYSSIEIDLKRQPELWSCNCCKSWFVQNIIPESESIRLYSQGSATSRWGNNLFVKTHSEDIVKILNNYLSRNKSVLDIGCCDGAFLDYAKAKGCVTFGVEYSEDACICLRNKGHKVFNCLDDITDSFDIITAFDLVEHLYNFPSLIADVGKRLKANGYLIVITGDNCSKEAFEQLNKWYYVSFPEHIIFPSIFSYRKLGFLVDYSKKIYPGINLKWTLSRIMRKIILVFSVNYSGWPFKKPNHYIVILKKK